MATRSPQSVEGKAKEMAGRWDFDPQIRHHFADQLYAKQAFFPAGSEIVSHKHAYSHLSILAQGVVHLYADDQPPVRYQAPVCIEIRAGVNHAIRAIEDAVWFCIHATDEKDPERVDRILIQDGEG